MKQNLFNSPCRELLCKILKKMQIERAQSILIARTNAAKRNDLLRPFHHWIPKAMDHSRIVPWQE